MPEYPATRTADISDLFMRSIPTKVLIYNNDRKSKLKHYISTYISIVHHRKPSISRDNFKWFLIKILFMASKFAYHGF